MTTDDGARRWSRGSGTGLGRRACGRRRAGQRAVAEQRLPGELRPRSRREAHRAAGGGRAAAAG